MLYISRRMSSRTYEVVDTDDGEASEYHYRDIEQAVLKYNIDIEGAIIGVTGKYISEYMPVQDTKYNSMELAKLKTLTGVEIRRYKDEIVAFIINTPHNLKPNTRIVLSKFGKRVNWHVSYRCGYGRRPILVADDNIELIGEFSRTGGLFDVGLLDITQVTNETVLREIYYGLLRDHLNHLESASMLTSYLIDHKERMKYWISAV